VLYCDALRVLYIFFKTKQASQVNNFFIVVIFFRLSILILAILEIQLYYQYVLYKIKINTRFCNLIAD